MDYIGSETCKAVMRAFAGECQAHTRYLLAAKTAAAQQQHLLRQIFEFTAKQELTHAQLLMQHLQKAGIREIEAAAHYPLDPSGDFQTIAAAAQQNELHEAETLYPAFAQTAAEEGFSEIAALFRGLSEIEQSHARRFQLFADLMQQGKLYREDGQTVWLCLNCGHLHTGTEPPQSCPVCGGVQSFAVREKLAPFTLPAGEPL